MKYVKSGGLKAQQRAGQVAPGLGRTLAWGHTHMTEEKNLPRELSSDLHTLTQNF